MVTHNLSRKGTGTICRELSASLILSHGTGLGCGPDPWWGPSERQPHTDIALVICVTLVKILYYMYFSVFLCKMGYIIAILPLKLDYLVYVNILCKDKTLYISVFFSYVVNSKNFISTVLSKISSSFKLEILELCLINFLLLIILDWK